MVTILALTAAVLYGSADFLGGVATRHGQLLRVLPLSAGAGAAIVVAAAILSGQPVHGAGLGWGIAGGVAGGIGLIIFYAGLAAGPMSVVAPVSALTATVLPVAVALAGGERASAIVYAGALLCLVAVVAVSSAGPRQPDRRGSGGLRSRLTTGGFHVRALGYGAAGGSTFGLFFVFLRNASHSGTLWPVAAARLAGLGVILLVAAVTRSRPVPVRASGRLLLATVGSGVLDLTWLI